MSGQRVIRCSDIASQFAGYAFRQCVFVVMSDRSKRSSPLFVSIGKDAADKMARSFREGREPATFKTACVKPGFVSATAEITLF